MARAARDPDIEGAVRAPETLQHASRVIGDWIVFYNNRRPHKALGMKTPAETFAFSSLTWAGFVASLQKGIAISQRVIKRMVHRKFVFDMEFVAKEFAYIASYQTLMAPNRYTAKRNVFNASYMSRSIVKWLLDSRFRCISSPSYKLFLLPSTAVENRNISQKSTTFYALLQFHSMQSKK